MNTPKKNWPKFSLAIAACLLFRLVPFRPPNVEPILATQMPFSKAYGAYVGALFALLSIILYDLITGTLGVWTILTAGTYGVLGFWAFFYFKNCSKPSRLDYAGFAVLGTLFFDAVTGLSIGPLFFHQSFLVALIGQIPFTLWHLVGNVSFSFVLSPAIYDLVTRSEKLKDVSFVRAFSRGEI